MRRSWARKYVCQSEMFRIPLFSDCCRTWRARETLLYVQLLPGTRNSTSSTSTEYCCTVRDCYSTIYSYRHVKHEDICTCEVTVHRTRTSFRKSPRTVQSCTERSNPCADAQSAMSIDQSYHRFNHSHLAALSVAESYIPPQSTPRPFTTVRRSTARMYSTVLRTSHFVRRASYSESRRCTDQDTRDLRTFAPVERESRSESGSGRSASFCGSLSDSFIGRVFRGGKSI